MRFEWDDQKAVENFAKHGVTFGEATEVFYDPKAVEMEDAEHSFNESRLLSLDTRAVAYFTSSLPNVIMM